MNSSDAEPENRSECPKKEICGCCGWSHLAYEQQLKQKLGDINGSFAQKGLSLNCNDIIPSPRTAHYRNRMDFTINYQGKVGLREKGKWWSVIDNHTCFIADRVIEQHFSILRDLIQRSGLSYFDRRRHTGLLRFVVLRASLTGHSLVNIVTSAPLDQTEHEAARRWLDSLATTLPNSTIAWSVNHSTADISFGEDVQIIAGPDALVEEIGDLRFRISPNAFFQTNSHTASLLLNEVLGACGDLHGKRVLDLYCGSGFFSLPLARRAAQVVGLEYNHEAIKDARRNALENNLSVEFIDAKAEGYEWRALKPDVMVVDPPRSGMHDDALAMLLATAPERLVYVSCNYKSFAREMLMLQEKFEVVSLRAIDQFPHTPHVELIATLQRRLA